MATFRQLLTTRLQAAFLSASLTPPEGTLIEVTNASDTRFGDYQSNAMMGMASAPKKATTASPTIASRWSSAQAMTCL